MLYHYTNGTKLAQIKKDGFIKSVPDITTKKEKPVAWLSTNPLFEKTANKIVMINGVSKLCNMEETATYCNGLYRFCFEKESLESLFQWPRLSVEARIPEKIKNTLTKRAKKAKVSPSQWWGVLGNISIANSTLERWDGQRWVFSSLDEEINRVDKDGLNVVTQKGMKRLPISDSEWSNI